LMLNGCSPRHAAVSMTADQWIDACVLDNASAA
jgi:hypothetical protein